MTISLGVFCRNREESYWFWMNEKPRIVVWNFSNHVLGACFKPYREQFSWQTLVAGEVDIPEGSFL
jgi:hypothetical protein